MTCDACGREHKLSGEIWIDDVLRAPDSWVEVLVEMMCKHGKLVILVPEDDRLVEPDAGGQA